MQNSLYKYFITVVCLFLALSIYGQKRRVEYSAEIMTGDKRIAFDAKRLIGGVVFRDNGTNMYCDSAYFYSDSQDFDAFSRVRVVPDNGKTTLTGHMLHYKANERMANISGNVLLKDQDATLSTSIIYYDVNTGIASYPTRGTIVSRDNTIVSEEGAFNRFTNQYKFKRKVVVTNPDYIIHTDTMYYNTVTKIVEFMGPTYIISAQKDSIYCERGWYDTNNHLSLFRRNAWMKGKGNTIWGDSLYYDENTMIGKAFGNVTMKDSSQNFLIKGNATVYDRKQSTALVTKRGMMVQIENNDSLYLHADTIFSGRFTEITDTISGRVDTFKYVKAYHHVKFFRANLQGKCDSLYYSFKDSTLQFIGKPVLWSDNMQLKGNHVTTFIKNKKMERMEIKGSSFIATQDDSVSFNQIKGRNMTGFFANNKMYRMEVRGNGQFLYFARDEGSLIGINKTESSDINLYMKDNKLNKITPINTVEGAFYPPKELSGADLFLKDFEWLEQYRPYNWKDIFVWERK
jgi:lipopolysaccharide export system protein LptA